MAKSETSHKGKKTLYKRFLAVLSIVTILVAVFAVTASASEASTQENANYYVSDLAPDYMYSNVDMPVQTIIDIPRTYCGEDGVTNASIYYGTKYTQNGADNSVTYKELRATAYRYETGNSEVYYNTTDLATAFGEMVGVNPFYHGHTLEWRNIMLNQYSTDQFSVMFRANRSGYIVFKVTVDAVGFDDDNFAVRYSETDTFALPITTNYTTYEVLELIDHVAGNATSEELNYIDRATVEITFDGFNGGLAPVEYEYIHKTRWAPLTLEDDIEVQWLNAHRYQPSNVITGVVDLVGTAFDSLDVTILKIDNFELTLGGVLTIGISMALFFWFIKQFAGG